MFSFPLHSSTCTDNLLSAVANHYFQSNDKSVVFSARKERTICIPKNGQTERLFLLGPDLARVQEDI